MAKQDTIKFDLATVAFIRERCVNPSSFRGAVDVTFSPEESAMTLDDYVAAINLRAQDAAERKKAADALMGDAKAAALAQAEADQRTVEHEMWLLGEIGPFIR